MILEMFSIYDAKVGTYSHPFFMPTIGKAIRAFESTVRDGGQSEISKYPHDFSLFHLGSYDDAKGRVENLSAPLHLASGHEFTVPTVIGNGNPQLAQ